MSLCMILSVQVSILVGELSSHFSDLKNQIDDPFLVMMICDEQELFVAIGMCC